MNSRSLVTLTAMALLSLAASCIARADETLKFRTIMHASSVQSQDIGDVDGHTVNLSRFSGIASFPDGMVGTSYFIAVADYIKGNGTFSIYNNLTLNDGSVLWYKAAGTTTVEGTQSLFQGTVTVVSGKGRFEGAKGDGTIIGARLTPLSAGAESYIDITINIKK